MTMTKGMIISKPTAIKNVNTSRMAKLDLLSEDVFIPANNPPFMFELPTKKHGNQETVF
jgi:hypothetical protein